MMATGGSPGLWWMQNSTLKSWALLLFQMFIAATTCLILNRWPKDPFLSITRECYKHRINFLLLIFQITRKRRNTSRTIIGLENLMRQKLFCKQADRLLCEPKVIWCHSNWEESDRILGGARFWSLFENGFSCNRNCAVVLIYDFSMSLSHLRKNGTKWKQELPSSLSRMKQSIKIEKRETNPDWLGWVSEKYLNESGQTAIAMKD